MKPTRPINVTGRDDWKYTHSSKTDVAATIRRVQREQRERSEAQRIADDEAQRKVRKLGGGK